MCIRDSTDPRPGAKIIGKTSEDWSDGGTDSGMDIEFHVADNGTALHATADVALVIGHDKNVTGELVDTSDVNKKNNIETIDNGLNVVNALNPVMYNWKRDGRKSQGFIAQEVEKILPHCVTGKDYIEGETSMGKGVKTAGIVASLVKAVQELTAKVEALENNNKQGESSNEQEQDSSNNNGGDASSESSGEDSGGVEGSSSDSSDASSGTSEASESSSDDGNESTGSSGSDASTDSEAGSGGDDSEGSNSESPSGEPSSEWTKDELKAYMDSNGIAYNSGDTKQDLLDKIGAANG